MWYKTAFCILYQEVMEWNKIKIKLKCPQFLCKYSNYKNVLIINDKIKISSLCQCALTSTL